MTQFIDKQWQEGLGSHFESLNPYNGEVIWQGKSANEAQVDQAIKSARTAFEAWGELSFEERKKYLEKFQEELTKHREELSELISKETGKPLWETNMEMGGMINKLNISIKAAEERAGTKVKESASVTAALRHKPHGVLAVFGPYNFPAHIPNGHIMPALLAGNTVVFKPSELTPAVAERTVQIWDASGLPKGVINLVQGSAETGIALSQHSQIDGLLFTGSSHTGKILHEQFGGQAQKILALEMGGNNPLIVHKASDLQAAAYLTIQSAFISAGQRCTCSRRLIVAKGQAGDEFINKLIEMTKTIKVGHYADEVFMGPVISSAQAKNLLDAQAELIKSGAKELLGMQLLQEDSGLLSPGILDSSNLLADQYKELRDKENFGPLLQIYRADDFDHAIEIANDTQYGLSAGLISDDKELYQKFFKKIRAGIVNWNNQLTGASSSAPFGGIGLSGNHRPSAYYAADYCAYPVASLESETLKLPEKLTQGLDLR